MNKYLAKIAEDKKKTSYVKSLAITAGAGAIGKTVGEAGMLGTQLAMMSKMENSKNTGANLSTIKHYMKHNDLKDVTFSENKFKKHLGASKGFHGFLKDQLHDQAGVHGNPAYFHAKSLGGGKNYVNKHGVKNHDVIMHELGHAKDFKRFGKTKMTANALSMFASHHPVGIVGQYAGAAALAKKKETRKYAPLVPLVAAAPTLINEGKANVNAMKGIHAHKGLKAALKYGKGVGALNTASYWSRPAGLAAGIYSATKILDHIEKNMVNKYLEKVAEKLKSYAEKGQGQHMLSSIRSRSSNANMVIHVDAHGKLTRSTIPGERHGLRNSFSQTRHGILKVVSHKDIDL